MSNIPAHYQAVWESSSIDAAMSRAPILILSFIMLWAINIIIFDKFRLPYTSVIPARNVNVYYVFFAPFLIIILLLFMLFLFHSSSNIMNLEYIMLLFYSIIIFLLYYICTNGKIFNKTYSDQTSPFLSLLYVVFNPNPDKIAFVEVLCADALCSLSKVLKDLGVTIIVLVASFNNVPVYNMHEGGMILIALLASLPFALRVRQCSIQLINTSDMYTALGILINILKYISSFPPIWIATYSAITINTSVESKTQTHMLMLTAATINSTLSYGWDIVMDWGLISFNIRPNAKSLIYFRPRLFYPVYYHLVAAIVNLIMRFSWMITMFESARTLNPGTLVLLVEAMEIIRRFIWNIFRVEWEIINKADVDKVEKEVITPIMSK